MQIFQFNAAQDYPAVDRIEAVPELTRFAYFAGTRGTRVVDSPGTRTFII